MAKKWSMIKEKDVLKDFLSQIGNSIREKRKDNAMSLEKLGLEIGLTRMQVHRIEKGYNITMTTLLKLSLALGIKPNELLKFDSNFKKEDLEKLVNISKGNKARGLK